MARQEAAIQVSGIRHVSPAQLTFLVGPNGAGKSNFLDALRFVADSLRFSIDHALRDRGGIGEVRRRSSGHPTHFAIRLDFDVAESKGRYTFVVGAKRRAGFQVQREECWVIPRSSDTAPQFYRVECGRVVKSSHSPAPAAAADRLYLVSVSGVGSFRPVYDALSGTGFYNLSPEAIRDLQPPDPGDLPKKGRKQHRQRPGRPRNTLTRLEGEDRRVPSQDRSGSHRSRPDIGWSQRNSPVPAAGAGRAASLALLCKQHLRWYPAGMRHTRSSLPRRWQSDIQATAGGH